MRNPIRREMLENVAERLPTSWAILSIIVAGGLMWFYPTYQELFVSVMVAAGSSLVFKMGLMRKGELWKWFKFKRGGVNTPKRLKLNIKDGQSCIVEWAQNPEDDFDVDVEKGGFFRMTTFTGESFTIGDHEKIELMQKIARLEKALELKTKKALEVKKNDKK